VTVDASEPVLAAYRRMKLYDVSQLPVMRDGSIVGIVDEEDILLNVFANSEHFNEPVTKAMVSRLITVPADASVSSLMEIFNRGMVAIVMDGSEFLGLVTRIDLLNWLRPQVIGRMSDKDSEHAFATRVIHGGQRPDPLTGAVMPPIYATST